MDIHLISKKGSRSGKILLNQSNLKKLYLKTKPELLVNYGIAGKRKEQLLNKTNLKGVPVVNLVCGYNKEKAVKIVNSVGIKVPETKSKLDKNDITKEWLIKKYHSIGGRDIRIAKTKTAPMDYYFQKFISNRKYELRVHAFSWLPIDKWVVQKRMGDKNTIAWNFHNGGRFITVKNTEANIFKEAQSTSEKILSTLKMEFGAIDFIVDEALNTYFIEINSQPGLNGLSDNIYIDAFNKLTMMHYKDILKKFNHH